MQLVLRVCTAEIENVREKGRDSGSGGTEIRDPWTRAWLCNPWDDVIYRVRLLEYLG